MSDNAILANALRGNLGFLKNTLADMTDADLAQRPVPNANNALWQLGHLIASEAMMVNGCAGKTVIELPAGFVESYSKEAAKENNVSKLGNKADLLALFDKTREKTATWAAALTPAEMNQPAPEMIRSFCPKVWDVVHLLPVHVAMHLGQIQVLRRKLGKPVLF